MLKAITTAITARASLINTCRFGSLGRGDRAGDITQFPTKSLTIYAGNNIIHFWFFLSLISISQSWTNNNQVLTPNPKLSALTQKPDC